MAPSASQHQHFYHLAIIAVGLLGHVVCSTVQPDTTTTTTGKPRSEDATTADHSTTQVPELIVPDHRFFLQEIFKKYGYDGQITFEGFEHLLGNLRLGNVIIQDHDLMSHKDQNAFVDLHNTHEHYKSVDSSDNTRKAGNGRRGERAPHVDNFELPMPKHHQSLSEASSHGHHKHHVDSHGSKDDHHGHRRKTEAHTDHSHGDHDQPHSKESHDHPPHAVGEIDPPEYLGNISDIVEEHDEVPNHLHEGDILAYGIPKRHSCLTPSEILSIYGIDSRTALNPISFLHLCPVIIYELDQQHCSGEHDHEERSSATSLKWLYSCLAVVLISLCGLFSVAVIPIMQKWFYHTLLQFLVGLAVGSLSGDAMLHLLPHAMVGGEDHDHDHEHGGNITAELDAVWRGMTGLGGIYFFFVAERLLNALTMYRRRKREKVFRLADADFQEQLQPSQAKNSGVGEKLSHYRRNSYGVNLDPDTKENIQMLEKDSKPVQMGSRHSSVHEVGFHGRSSFSADPVSGSLFVPGPQESSAEGYVVTFTEHHGHSHGHSHEVPQSVSAVAWMVIMGDGLHNFCDGMAIGAAFASSIAGGISTTVAVFCHELPHELGDFAMLLKTGMTVKRALLYNCLSSALCFIGMAIGVSLGSVNSATSWIFAGTAGMFLYIALVDMLPELATPNDDPNSNTTYTLAVQVLGISIGVSVMLLIAIYERDLKNLVS